MRTSRLPFSGLLALIFVQSSVHAASILDFDKWMQVVEKRAISVQKHIEKQDAQASAADARQIEDLYVLIQAYFEEQGDAESAVDLSRKGREAVANVAVLVNANQFDDAMATMKNLMVECRTCHHAYKPLY
jgi:hypothetical protein